MHSDERFAIPLLKQLIPDGVKPATIFVVEFDPESQWYPVATTIAARYLQEGSRTLYASMTRPPQDVKRAMLGLGVDVAEMEGRGVFRVDDWYSATLAQDVSAPAPLEWANEGGARIRSLKVSDLSVEFLRWTKQGSPDPVDSWPQGSLAIVDSFSPMMRFNEERVFLEFLETRLYPFERMTKRIELQGYVRGVHGDSFYRRIESACDGVIEIRVLERDDEIKNFLRIRSLKGQRHDARWHEIEIQANGETRLTS
jgi:KaiC/GvpD/RAD55 family RecA-like ATPase